MSQHRIHDKHCKNPMNGGRERKSTVQTPFLMKHYEHFKISIH
jgi:hypothetical protein